MSTHSAGVSWTKQTAESNQYTYVSLYTQKVIRPLAFPRIPAGKERNPLQHTTGMTSSIPRWDVCSFWGGGFYLPLINPSFVGPIVGTGCESIKPAVTERSHVIFTISESVAVQMHFERPSETFPEARSLHLHVYKHKLSAQCFHSSTTGSLVNSRRSQGSDDSRNTEVCLT